MRSCIIWLVAIMQSNQEKNKEWESWMFVFDWEYSWEDCFTLISGIRFLSCVRNIANILARKYTLTRWASANHFSIVSHRFGQYFFASLTDVQRLWAFSLDSFAGNGSLLKNISDWFSRWMNFSFAVSLSFSPVTWRAISRTWKCIKLIKLLGQKEPF